MQTVSPSSIDAVAHLLKLVVSAVRQQVGVEGGQEAEEVLRVCAAQLGVNVLLSVWRFSLVLLVLPRPCPCSCPCALVAFCRIKTCNFWYSSY